jgi:hypothetical protein
MKKFIATFLLAMLFTSASVFAHTTLESSIPSDNAMLMKSPKTVELSFGSNVRLVSLSVLNDKNEEVEIDFAPSMEPGKSFTYDLPTLMPSKYKVMWTIMGDDGHKMKGDFSFMMHAIDTMKDKKMDHSQHSGH